MFQLLCLALLCATMQGSAAQSSAPAVSVDMLIAMFSEIMNAICLVCASSHLMRFQCSILGCDTLTTTITCVSRPTAAGCRRGPSCRTPSGRCHRDPTARCRRAASACSPRRNTSARCRRDASAPEHPAELSAPKRLAAARAAAGTHRRRAQRRRLLDAVRRRLLGAGRVRLHAPGDLPRLHIMVRRGHGADGAGEHQPALPVRLGCLLRASLMPCTSVDVFDLLRAHISAHLGQQREHQRCVCLKVFGKRTFRCRADAVDRPRGLPRPSMLRCHQAVLALHLHMPLGSGAGTESPHCDRTNTSLCAGTCSPPTTTRAPSARSAAGPTTAART